jgi:hypothetical protein
MEVRANPYSKLAFHSVASTNFMLLFDKNCKHRKFVVSIASTRRPLRQLQRKGKPWPQQWKRK